MSKINRTEVFNKFGGKCAYCGCDLPHKGWHVDHVEPCRREWKTDYDFDKQKTIRKQTGFTHPERNVIENMVPACASCNINKHSESVESFRDLIQNFINSLNQYSVQYRFAKRYGLVSETGVKVEFYYEKYQREKESEAKLQNDAL